MTGAAEAWVVSGLLLAGTGMAAAAGAARLGDLTLRTIALSSLALRTAVTAALYLISSQGLPMFHSLQLGNGFWRFAPDAAHYHHYSLRIVDAWRHGATLPPGLDDGWYFLVVSAIYQALGPHALHGLVLNLILGTASTFLAYAAARQLGGIAPARLAADLMAFWPSLILWSSQLLKEQIVIFLVLLTVALSVSLLQRDEEQAPSPASVQVNDVLRVAGLGLAMLLTAVTRPLYALTLALSGIAVFGVRAVAAGFSQRWPHAGLAIVAAAAIAGGALIGQMIEPLYKFSPQPHAAPPAPQPSSRAESRVAVNTTGVDPGGALRYLRGLAAFPQTMMSIRTGQRFSAGHSQIHPEADISTAPKLLAYLPIGLAHAFFAPFPWQAAGHDGAAGSFKVLSLIEMFLVYALIPSTALGAWGLIRAQSAAGWFLLIFLLAGMTVLALTMVNMGSLFRYRLPFLTSLMLFASVGRRRAILAAP